MCFKDVNPIPCCRGWTWLVWVNQYPAPSCPPLWLELVQSDWRERFVAHGWKRISLSLPSLFRTWNKEEWGPNCQWQPPCDHREKLSLLWNWCENIWNRFLMLSLSHYHISLGDHMSSELLRGFNIPKYTVIFREGSVVQHIWTNSPISPKDQCCMEPSLGNMYYGRFRILWGQKCLSRS